ncbi:MAG: hypothetical protein EAZ24_04520 [Burkholderiales bacterium]|nr:MAG: hypothetical protein EAZ24_04520 [Burkholderiales bacterium]
MSLSVPYVRRRAIASLAFAPFLFGCRVNSSKDQNSTYVKPPERILPDTAWSFKEPAAESIAVFLAALREYGRQIGVKINEDELSAKMGIPSIDIEYEYGIQLPNGSWEDKTETVRLRPSQSLTYGELLFEIHKVAREKLHDQDHCFFEGLWLTERYNEPGIPLYEMYLGS